MSLTCRKEGTVKKIDVYAKKFGKTFEQQEISNMRILSEHQILSVAKTNYDLSKE